MTGDGYGYVSFGSGSDDAGGPTFGEVLSMECRECAPFACDDPDRHLGVPSEYTPLRNRGCHCGADFDGRDCMCWE